MIIVIVVRINQCVNPLVDNYYRAKRARRLSSSVGRPTMNHKQCPDKFADEIYYTLRVDRRYAYIKKLREKISGGNVLIYFRD